MKYLTNAYQRLAAPDAANDRKLELQFDVPPVLGLKLLYIVAEDLPEPDAKAKELEKGRSVTLDVKKKQSIWGRLNSTEVFEAAVSRAH